MHWPVLLILAALALAVVPARQVLLRFPGLRGIVPFEPRKPVPWGAADFLLIVLAYLVVAVSVGQWLRGTIEPQPPVAPGPVAQAPAEGQDEAVERDEADREAADVPEELSATALALEMVVRAGVIALAVLLLHAARGADDFDLGVRPLRIGYDVKLGLSAFVVLAVPIYAIQYLLSLFFPTPHPLVELVAANPDPLFFLVAAASAVVVAPITEEFLFRVVLQGWLEAAETRLLMAEGMAELREGALKGAGDEGRLPPPTSPGFFPILTSSLVFSLAHLAHGPAPVPLLFLSLALGYLYHRTHRLLPCVVLHAALNASSMILLWLMIRSGQLPAG